MGGCYTAQLLFEVPYQAVLTWSEEGCDVINLTVASYCVHPVRALSDNVYFVDGCRQSFNHTLDGHNIFVSLFKVAWTFRPWYEDIVYWFFVNQFLIGNIQNTFHSCEILDVKQYKKRTLRIFMRNCFSDGF